MTIGRVNLSKVINEEFVTTIQKMSQLSSSSATSSSESASTTSLSSSMQGGASIYATSVSALNSLVSYLNVSTSTLSTLLDLTDGMISLAEKAKSNSIGNQTRNKLNVKYSRLIKDFKEILDEADASDNNFLTKDGLSSLFSIVGLQPETSESIIAIFEEFFFDGEDETLANEEIKSNKKNTIPYAALEKTVTSETSKYSAFQITSIDSSTGNENTASGISTNNNVVSQVVDGEKTVSFISKTTGEVSTLGNDGYQYELKTVNESSGFAVVSKYETEESLADLYLYDNKGTLIQRLTDSAQTYGEVAISDDSKSILYTTTNDLDEESLKKITINSLGEDGTIENIETKNVSTDSIYTNLKISSDGSYFAYSDSDTGTNYLKNYETLASDSAFSSNINITDFDFVGTNTVAVYDGTNLQSYEYGSSLFNNIVSNVSIDKLDAIGKKDGEHYYLAYTDSTDGKIKVINDGGSNIMEYEFDTENDHISSLSLAYNSSGVVELGIFGKVSNISQDNDEELYRINGERPNKYSRASKIATTVFDSSLNLKSPADAYRVIDALSTLKDQLETNLKAMDNATNVVSLNIDLVRATGFALLDLSEQITSSDDAESIARKLKNEIRSNAPQALSQAENLHPLAVAAMMLNDDV